MKVAVVIPIDVETGFGHGDRWRQQALRYVLHHLDPITSVEPDVVSIGVCEGEWCKADAVADGIARTDADVVIVHDADVIVQLRAIERAVVAVNEEIAQWAIPHNLVHRLDEVSTDVVLKTGLVPTQTRQLVRWPYVGMVGGGITVMRRDTYLDCPLDARFKGWGSEDQSWGFALETLHGQPWRGDADLFHLFHPHAEPGAQRSPRFDSERLRRAYRAYRDRPDRMRALVDEAKVSLGRVGSEAPSQPPR